MALTVNSQEASGAAHRAADETSPQTSSFTNTSGNFLLAAVVATDTSAVTLNVPTYNGVSGTLIGSQLSVDGGNTKLAFYRWLTPATGANTFSCSGSGGTSHFRLQWALISLATADGTTPTGTLVSAVSGANGTTASTGNITNTSGNILISAAVDGDGSLVAGAGNTLSAATSPADTNTGGNNLGLQYFAATGTTRNMQMTFTPSSNWGTVGVEVKAAATTAASLVTMPPGVWGALISQ